MGEDQSILVMECMASLNMGEGWGTHCFWNSGQGSPLPLLLPSQMDFCIISNRSALIDHTIHICASVFITCFVEFKPFCLSHFLNNFSSCENSEEYCHSDVIKAFPANTLFYSNPIRFWRTVHMENLNPKFFMGRGTVFPKEKLLSHSPWHSQLFIWGRNWVTWVLTVGASFLGLVCF